MPTLDVVNVNGSPTAVMPRILRRRAHVSDIQYSGPGFNALRMPGKVAHFSGILRPDAVVDHIAVADAELLARYEQMQRGDRKPGERPMSVAERDRAKQLWSAALRIKVDNSSTKRAEADRLQVVVSVDPDDLY